MRGFPFLSRSCPADGGPCRSGDFTEDFVIDIGTSETGLCGSSFGGGCTAPTASNGTITLRIWFRDQGVSQGVRFWSVGPAVAP